MYIPILLKILGLDYIKINDMSYIAELVKENRKIFDSQLDITYNGNYDFPDDFDCNIFIHLFSIIL